MAVLPRLGAGAILGAALGVALQSGCNPTRHTDFPLEVGYEPLEAMSDAALPPAPTLDDPYPQGLGNIVHVPASGHFASHARGYLHAPLATVYEALHYPTASYIHNDGGGTRLSSTPTCDVEPFPVSFSVRYANSTIIGEVKFEVTYRAGPAQVDGGGVPTVIGQRYQKTWGTTHIQVMSGSLVAYAVDGAPDVTLVEMIEWLRADTQRQSDCDGTLIDLFGDLKAKIADLPGTDLRCGGP